MPISHSRNLSRILAVFLTFTLALPNSALALPDQQRAEAGLEELERGWIERAVTAIARHRADPSKVAGVTPRQRVGDQPQDVTDEFLALQERLQEEGSRWTVCIGSHARSSNRSPPLLRSGDPTGDVYLFA